ncbi:MAG TPA: LOG family protein [Gemmatales bacterium]|nr:LOG family protein [Gemmatales bacterium]HMP60919.1 LOG family protein [Gemmatales bacterium]
MSQPPVPPATGATPPAGAPPHTFEHFIEQMKSTAEKFLRDRATRADVKLVATALRELRYALKVFSHYRHQPKITIFGSARTPADHPSYQQCVEFARQLVAQGYLIITGAGPGIMEAGHVGAGVDHSLGVNILLPFEQAANHVVSGSNRLVHLKYFFTRKLMLLKESQAVAVFPGGYGTHDETFEVLTLIQTCKSPIIPIVLVEQPGGDYWKHWLAFVTETLLSYGYISPADLSLFRITDSVDTAVQEVLGFFRVYHSMRYVGDDAVMRLHRELTPPLLDALHDQFGDVLASGRFEQTAALPAEASDTHIAHLPRLRFHFDKKKVGRLRQMIDYLNTHG